MESTGPPKRPSFQDNSRDDFEFGSIIGQGAYSYVRRCRRKGSEEAFAAKIIEKRLVNREKKLDQVMAESRTLKKLTHPNIVQFISSFRDRKDQNNDENSGFFYIIMESLDGGELLQLIRQFGALDPDTVRFITAEMVSALEHMHGQGFVHRDVKPHNIVLNSENHAKLVDFGCVKAAAECHTDVRLEGLLEEIVDVSDCSDPAVDLRCAQLARELASELQVQSRGLAKYEMTILGDIVERLCACKIECRNKLLQLLQSLPQPPEEGWGDRWVLGPALSSASLDELGGLHGQLQLSQSTEYADKICEWAFKALTRRKRCAQLARDTAMRQTREYDRACMVGTQDYQAPELCASEARASQSSDLWAYGCVLYQMITGSVHSPYQGVTDYITSQKIVASDYSWPVPSCLDQDAMLFATSLMSRQPAERLGCAEGSSYQELWSHGLLSSIDSQLLHSLVAPVPSSNADVNCVTRPSLCDEQLPGGQLEQKEDQGAAHGAASCELQLAQVQEEARLKLLNLEVASRERSRWAQFLLPGENIVLSSLLRKRAHIFSNPERRFLLTEIRRNGQALSRLLYIDERRMVQRGEVPWSEHTRAELKEESESQFEIVTPRNVFKLEDPGKQAKVWVQEINRLVKLVPQRSSNHTIEEHEGMSSMCNVFCR